MSNDIALPTFGDWLRWQSTERGLTPAALARELGLPKPTVAALLSGRSKRPGIEVAGRIASGLEYPRLALAVISGHADRMEVGQAEEAAWLAAMPWVAQLSAGKRSAYWSQLGLRLVDALAGAMDPAVVRERWRARGVAGLMEDTLHQRHRGLIDNGFFDALSGPALALVVDGAGGSAPDLLGVAAAMALIGPGICRAWGCAVDWDSWADVAGPIIRGTDGDMERFEPGEYLAACHEVKWTIEVPAPVVESDTATPAEDADPLVGLWDRLTSVQKSAMRAILASWSLP